MLTALRAVRARGSPLPGLRRALLAFVMLVSIPLIAVDSPILTMAGALALTVYLVLSWRQFSFGSWVPVVLSVVALILALRRDIPSEVILRAADRMVFLATLIAMLGTLRSAAVFAPEVARAGIFLTNQPASRRYLALASGGHLFGVLINFGGLALLLDLAARSMSSQATRDLPPDVQEARRRRMTIATIRGFGLISLWSPFGFATNAILITLPGISYWQFGPLGFAMSFLFLGVGWAFDRWQGRRFRQQGLRPAQPPEGAWIGAAMLVGHVLLLGALVAVLQAAAPISFQQSLILVVPAYSLLWAALTGWQEARRPAQGIRRAADATWHRLAEMGPEVSVFAAAGFLPVMLLAMIPVGALQDAIAALGLEALPMALGLVVAIVLLAFVGINPIVSSSILGAIAVQLAIPGLGVTVIALAITGGWSAVIGLSPFLTTLIIAASVVGRPTWVIGPVWNGAYSLTILCIWLLLLSGLMLTGMIG